VLDVRDVKTGDSLWSFTCDEGLFSPIIPPEAGTDYSPLIANNYVFLSSCSTTYAVDLMTHQAVWSDPVAGFPVVSHEKLYVSSPNGFLHMYSAAPTDVDSGDETILPDKFALDQNYPNPFNASTRIDYYLPKAGHVKLTIHNILGQTVQVLVDEFQPPGEKTIYWDGRDRNGVPVATGIYLYNLQAGDFLKTKKMLLLK
jgi:outer membrane protein assembly factor BamB